MRTLLTSVTLIGMMLGSAAQAGTIELIDQQNLVGPGGASSSRLSQSFTPTLDRIDFAEFELSLQSPTHSASTLRLEVKAGETNFGPILGYSLPHTLTSFQDQIVRLDLVSPTVLIPGQKYTLNLVKTNFGPGFSGRISVDNPYSGGSMVQGDNLGVGIFGDRDLVFRTGIYVPEPSTAGCLIGLTLASMCLFRDGRRRVPKI